MVRVVPIHRHVIFRVHARVGLLRNLSHNVLTGTARAQLRLNALGDTGEGVINEDHDDRHHDQRGQVVAVGACYLRARAHHLDIADLVTQGGVFQRDHHLGDNRR